MIGGPSAATPPGGALAESADESLRSKMRAGVVFWGLGNLAAKIVKLAVQVVLAWLLDPTDYGLVAMTLAFMIVLQMLSEFGVGIAVIQKKDMPDSYPSTAFWLNFGMSVGMAAAAWAAAPWLASFYNEPRVELLVKVSSFGFPITALRTIPMAILRKRLRFGRYAGIDAAWQIATTLLTLVCALGGMGYWSLVVPQMVTGLFLAPVWFTQAGWRPNLKFAWASFSEILGFSINTSITSLAAFVLGSTGFIIAGHYLGIESAGIYKFATENAMFITFNIAWTVSNVTVSAFALMQDDNNRLYSAFGQVYDILLAVTMPLHILLFVEADLVFAVAFPDKWLPAVPLFRVLLLNALFRSLVGPVIQFFYAVNRPQVNLWLTLAQMVVMLPCMLYGCRYYGLEGLAWGTTAPFVLVSIVTLMLMPHLNRWDSLHYIRRSFSWLIGASTMAAVAICLNRFGAACGLPGAATLMLSSGLGALTYPVFARLLNPTRFDSVASALLPKDFWNRLRGLLSFRRSAA